MSDISAETAETNPLMAFAVAVLSALMAPCLIDPGLARLAAQQAIGAYRTGAEGGLVTIAQIAGFAVTALDTLRLSMPETLSLSMKLKLRGNANALNRSARDNTRILEKAPGAAPAPAPVSAVPTPAPEPAIQPLTEGEWGNAMTSVAVRLRTDAAIVSPAQRQTDALWIEALNGVAGELARTKSQTGSPGTHRAGLLRSTLLASNPGLVADLFNGGKRKCA
jgi:hypothetical protein